MQISLFIYKKKGFHISFCKYTISLIFWLCYKKIILSKLNATKTNYIVQYIYTLQINNHIF